MDIPAQLHLTWKTRTVPEGYRKNLESWKATHPDWTVQVWSDADIRELISSQYPDFLEIFDRYEKAIMRADAFRYFVLHHLGGVYADLDIFAHQNLCPLLNTSTCFLTLEPDSHAKKPKAIRRGLEFIVCNALMGSVPGHPFWPYVIKLLRRQAEVPYVLDSTGPFMLTGAALSCPAHQRPDLMSADAWSPADAESMPSSAKCAEVAASRGFRILGEKDDSSNAVFVEHQWHSSWCKVKPGVLGNLESMVRKLKYRLRRTRHGAIEFRVSPPPVPIQSQNFTPPTRLPRLAIATPIKQAAKFLEAYGQIIESVAYPPELIELCFVVSDSSDGTMDLLQAARERWKGHFRRIQVEEVNFGFHAAVPRWQPSIQRRRRANIAHCRNRLAELASESDYVLFLDVDLTHVPTDIVQTLLGAEAPVVMANCVDELDRVFDLNSFFYEEEPSFGYKSRALKDGLFQPEAKWPRMYLSDVAYLNKVPLDCVGGTCLLVEQSVFQSGVRFPEEPFQYHIETEGFSLWARDRGFEVLGLPNVKVVHPRR